MAFTVAIFLMSSCPPCVVLFLLWNRFSIREVSSIMLSVTHITLKGFFTRADFITFTHSKGVNTYWALRFFCSISPKSRSLSIMVWPGTKNLCSIEWNIPISTRCCHRQNILKFLFCPPHESDQTIRFFFVPASSGRACRRQEAISSAPLLATCSGHTHITAELSLHTWMPKLYVHSCLR